MPAPNRLEPGIHDLDELDYHARPELSSSGAQRLLDCPAKFQWRRTIGGEEHRDAFDLGHAVHALILGVGRDVVVVEADDWRTKDAKAAKTDAHASGRIPLLAKDWARAKAMADAVHDHPVATVLLDPTVGRVEQSAVWQDPRTGVWCRARFDKLPDLTDERRLIVVDVKTTLSAKTEDFAKSAASYGYAMQHAWYVDALRVLLGRDDVAFVFIAIEKEPPYLVNVVELTADFVSIGRERNQRALDLYVQCTRTGIWPGFGEGVNQAEPPKWFVYEHEAQFGPESTFDAGSF